MDREGALSAAAASEKRWLVGAALGPLDGVPLTVKDNIPVRGLRTTWGSNLYANYVPATDELPIARLREAGAIILGKTNCPEFTLQGYTDNLLFGPTRNPWNLELTPGGSSGGAVAAVSAGIGPHRDRHRWRRFDSSSGFAHRVGRSETVPGPGSTVRRVSGNSSPPRDARSDHPKVCGSGERHAGDQSGGSCVIRLLPIFGAILSRSNR